MATGTQKAADLLLDGCLSDFVASRRAEGLSWRRIAQQLTEATDGEIDVAHETIRNWFPDLAPTTEPAA